MKNKKDINNLKITQGLRELPKDDRDLKVGIVFRLPKVSELPESFFIGFPTVRDQMDSDFCAAFSACEINEIHEGVELSPEWLFAVGKMIEGGVDEFGLNLRTVCKAFVKYGCIEASEAPYSLENKPVDFLRRIENWSEDLFLKAEKHKQQSFFSVSGTGEDAYDTIRQTMWKFRNEKNGILFGVLWGWNLSDIVLDTIPTSGTGHAISGLGWDTKGLFIQNHYGLEAGESGRHYLSREVVNNFVDKYGCFMFHDMPKETARFYTENGIKQGDNWFIQFIKIIKNIFK